MAKLKENDKVLYSALSAFNLKKKDEDTILIGYPSESARSEFEKISGEFLNHFRHKVEHFNIQTEFRIEIPAKKEFLTKRKQFEKMAEINPLLYELQEIMKFDLS